MTANARRRRILVTGANGQLGWELQRTISVLGEVVAVDEQELDLNHIERIAPFVRDVKPTIIVNAAARTDVDQLESDVEAAHRVNGEVPGVLAEEARRLNALLVHYSTDYVFDGSADRPYRETDPTNPINVYGASKLAGERAVAQAGGRWLVLRTSWVYANRGSNFLLTMLRLAMERPALRVVADQFGAPTWSRSLAEATTAILSQLLSEDAPPGEPVWDVYHLTAGGQTSWAEYARAIFELSVENGLIGSAPTVEPIASAEYPTAAERPRYSCLSNDKLASMFGVRIDDWRTDLARCLAERAALVTSV